MIWLKEYLETWLKTDVEVSKTKGGFGDYTTNLVMKKMATKDETMAYLHQHELIDHVEFKNGYINIFVVDHLLYLNGTLGNELRLLTLHNRLSKEGYTKGELSSEWLPLAKLVAELHYSLAHCIEDKALQENLLKCFTKIDIGYVYRAQSDKTLGGIYQLIHDTLVVLGRLHE